MSQTVAIVMTEECLGVSEGAMCGGKEELWLHLFGDGCEVKAGQYD